MLLERILAADHTDNLTLALKIMSNHDEDTRSYDTDSGTTLLQGSLNDPDTSALKKYQRINVGRSRGGRCLGMSCTPCCLAPLPGAAGYVLRRMALKSLLGRPWARGSSWAATSPYVIPGRSTWATGVAVDDYAVLDAKGDNKGHISRTTTSWSDARRS
jgi:hypothetical protein